MPNRSKVLAAVVVAALVAPLLVLAPPASARMVPQTLADRRPVQVGPVEVDFPIDHLGVLWNEVHRDHDEEHGHDEDAGTEPHGAVRFRHDGVWGPWIRLIEDGIEGPLVWASGLVPGADAEAYQVRGVPAGAVQPRVVAINTTDGPEIEVSRSTEGAAGAISSDRCRSRAEWGADESLRFSAGSEIWPPVHYPAQVLTVHHTATENDDPDPAATVRAIYRYHAVDQGWGDIGYQYLIDEQGVVYEGRWSGAASTDCGAGGDGSDFGHEEGDADGDGLSDEMVTGAHTGGSNSGNLGIALLGEFTDHPRFGADPKAEAVTALEGLLTEHAARHTVDPMAVVEYVNPVTGEQRSVDAISGHRDWTATECPGERLYSRLPTIRQSVKDALASPSDPAPTVSITSPADGATVSGTVTVTADASTDVTQVVFSIGTTSVTDVDGSNGWTVGLDTTATSDGAATITATATDDVGQSATASIGVTVDNVEDPVGSTVHVADLDGAASAVKSRWYATVTISVVDDTGTPVTDAAVIGGWTPSGGTSTCTTGSGGTCSVTSPTVDKKTDSLTFTVDSVSHASLSYAPGNNTDPDGDSDGTIITVAKPR